ncbi:acyltransferase family protein [Photobacterium sagamiensis]|uniref:acyltransferase n=1 Tax=Photobacterium sagamiensis TaxID=2910241 RepID=UPI003D0F5203
MKRISSFEWGRLLALLAIITIHAKPFMTLPVIDDQPWAGMILNQLSRFAVPLFFLLAGYFIQPSLTVSPKQTLIRYCSPLFKVWVVWSVISLLTPFNLTIVAEQGYLAERSGYWNFLLQNPLNTLFEGGLVHLWYIPALLCAVAIVSVLMSFKLEKLIIPVALALYVFGLMAGSYQPVFGVEPAIMTRNGPFFSTLIVALGFEIRRNDLRIPLPAAVTLLFSGMILHLTEAYLLIAKGSQFISHDFLLGTPIWALGLFFVLQAKPSFGDSPRIMQWSKDVLGVYLCHLLIIIYLMNLSGLLGISILLRDLTIIPLTFVLSMLLIKAIDKTPLRNVLLR